MTDTRKLLAKLAVAAVAGVALVLFVTGAFGPRRIRAGSMPSAVDSRMEGTRLVVKPQTRQRLYTAVGTVRSRDEVEVSPRIIGRVEEVSVRSGDLVKKGDLLIRLHSQDLEAQVRQAEDALRSAQAALDLAVSEEKRAQTLFAEKVIARSALDRAVATLQQARAGVAAAENEIQQVRATLRYAEIRSPFDGVVAERNVDVGDLASPGNILLRLFDPTRLQLAASVRESLMPRIKLNAEVFFTVPALDKTIKGRVEEIVPAVDPHSRTFLVKVRADENTGLVPGMYGIFRLNLGEEAVLLVPEAALTRVGQLVYVTVERDRRAERRLVRTVPGDGNEVRVLSGLNPGEVLIVPEALATEDNANVNFGSRSALEGDAD